MSRVLKNVSKQSFAVVTLVCLLFSVLAVNAQGSVPTPINVGENQTGELTADAPSANYSITVESPQAVQIQVLAITQGFAPAFQVMEPSGIVIQSVANTSAQTIAQAMPLFSSPGTYQVEVQSANGQFGQFLISVQAGPTLPPPQPLALSQPLNGSVSSESPLQAYSFSGSETEVLLLTVRSDAPASGPIVRLTDADTGETLAVSSARMAGVLYRIPIAPTNYLVEVTASGALTAETFVVCLESENGPITCSSGTQTALVPTAAVPTQPPAPLPSTGSCVVASTSGGAINVRSGPGTDFSVVSQLAGSATAPVVGRLPDGSWYQVNINGILGWTSATVIRFGGDCSTVPTVTLTPTTAAPTPTGTLATATPTTQMTATPTSTPGNQPTRSGFPLTLVGPTLAGIEVEPIEPRLDYTANPNYGQANLSAGFSPDPYSVGMTTGGSVDVSYLGGSCAGFATVSPDLRVNFGGGGSSLLRIYFVGSSGDTTMVVNDPFGNFYCVDDSFGTVNPTIDFNNPAGGTYDIWIGSYAANTFVSGTLYITENSGNHP